MVPRETGVIMRDILEPVARLLQAILPDLVRLPDLTFELPHWIYWPGLLLFPLIAMWLVKRAEERRTGRRIQPSIAWLLWLWSGFAGLHRFYLRAPKLGFVYVGLFVLVLLGNKYGKVARELQSEAQNTVRDTEFQIERWEKLLAKGTDGAAAKLEQARQAFATAKQEVIQSNLSLDVWDAFSGGIALAIFIMLVVDAIMMRKLIARAEVLASQEKEAVTFLVMERGPKYDPRHSISNPAIRAIETFSEWTGSFVAYWSLLAVFVYYYEVIARYVFNSPTNWAHESMFLMFGMQYLLSGAYTLRHDAHVRVDVIYEKFTFRTRAAIDVVTSFFFFVFAFTLLLTGALFALDSVKVLEVSFTEWAIQYWPVKLAISIGAVLLIVQGAVRLARDLIFLSTAPPEVLNARHMDPPDGAGPVEEPGRT